MVSNAAWARADDSNLYSRQWRFAFLRLASDMTALKLQSHWSSLSLSLSSSFNLDAFKRSHSNETPKVFHSSGRTLTRRAGAPRSELKKMFMVSNLVSGMMQHMEKLRKYAFASVLILGEEDNAAIEGVWVMRGRELAFNVSINVL